MSRNQRKSYRVGGESTESIRVAVRDARGRSYPGRVLDVSISGVGIELNKASQPSFGVGDLVDVSLGFPGRSRPMKAPGRITSARETGGTIRFGVLLKIDEAGREALAGEAYRLLNRRAAYRVRPDVRETVQVRIPALGLAGRLRDISFDNLGVLFGSDAGERLEEEAEIRLALDLPGVHGQVELDATVHRRASIGRGWMIGLIFAGAQTPEARKSRETVRDFVMARQREELARRRDTAA